MENTMENKKLSFDDLMNVIRELSYSQGFYGRLYREILEVKEYDPDSYEELVFDWDGRFSDSLDFILYLET